MLITILQREHPFSVNISFDAGSHFFPPKLPIQLPIETAKKREKNCHPTQISPPFFPTFTSHILLWIFLFSSLLHNTTCTSIANAPTSINYIKIHEYVSEDPVVHLCTIGF